MKNLTKTAVFAAFVSLILSATAHAGPGLLISDRAATVENTSIPAVVKEESADKGGLLVSDRDGIIIVGRAGLLISDRAGLLISDVR